MHYAACVSLGMAACLALSSGSAGEVRSLHIGQYECWANNRPRTMLNFTLQANRQYADANGERGTYSFDGRNVAFRGGALDGQRPAYELRRGRPTMSFSGAGGAVALLCAAIGQF